MTWGQARAATALLCCLAPGLVLAIQPMLGVAAAWPWINPEQTPAIRAAELLGRMTMREKLQLVEGDGTETAQCVGRVHGIRRLGIPALCLGDGAGGVSNGLKQVTQFPAPIALAASWDTTLAREYGVAQGEEQAGKGRNVALTPTINILRSPRWGRAAETYGEDPYLTARLGTAVVRGLQSQHVIAMPKHFAANNQETNRFGEMPSFDAIDVRISERALREIYFPAFRAVVEDAHAGAIMCAYNKVNGCYACESPQLLQPLRAEWDFTGFVTSDWFFATRSTVQAARAGLDQSMPGGPSPFGLPEYYGAPLRRAVEDGSVSRQRLDSMVRHILTAMFANGLFDHLNAGSASDDVRTAGHRQLAERVAAEGTVLLKNRDRVLPLLRSVRSIAVIGDDADSGALTTEPYGGFVGPDADVRVVTPLAGIRARAVAGTRILYSRGTLGIGALPGVPAGPFSVPGRRQQGWLAVYYRSGDMRAAPTLTRVASAVEGRLPSGLDLPKGWSVRWRATLMPPRTGTYRFSLSGGGTAELSVADRRVVTLTGEQFHRTAQGEIRLHAGQPVPIEVTFRTAAGILPPALSIGWQLPDPTLLARAVRMARESEVAIVFAGDAISEGADRQQLSLPGDQNALISAVARANPRTVVVLNTGSAVLMPWLEDVAGVLEAWYPGEADGQAIAAVLFGDVDPSGRLPETFPAGEQQGPATEAGEFPGVNGTVRYDEGLLVGYRWYDAKAAAPLFPFGYGLSYTSFRLSGLEIADRRGNETETVSLHVANTGSRSGAVIVQLYVGYPSGRGEPPRQLKDFRRVELQPGQAVPVSFVLTPQQLQIWRSSPKGWLTPPGRYVAYVGTSSRDLQLRGGFTIPSEAR